MPREVHEHFDPDGVLTGRTVVTRESEWDDETRDRVLALAAYEDMLCACGCGLPIGEAHTKQPFIVDTVTCHAGRALERKRRDDQKKAEEDELPDGWNDGVHYFVRVLDEDKETARAY